MSKKKSHEEILEQNLSNSTLLLKVEDLIRMAAGPPEENRVNFKVLQTVLYLLARQMRLLNQQVELRISDESDVSDKLPSGATEEEKAAFIERQKAAADKAAARKEQKEKERAQKEKDREQRQKEKSERSSSKERDKEEKKKAKSKDRTQGDSSLEDIQADDKKTERHKKDKKAAKESEKGERDKDEREKDKHGATREGGAKKDDDAETKGKSDKDPTRKSTKGVSDVKEKDGRSDETSLKSKDKSQEADSTEGKKKGKEADSPEGKKKGKDKQQQGISADSQEISQETDDAVSKGKAKDKEKTGTRREDAADYKEISKDKGQTRKTTTSMGGGYETDKTSTYGVSAGKVKDHSLQRVGSIEVVTKQQFAALEKAVQSLQQKTGPLPMPVMPDNKKLLADIAKGQATLTETMNAMKLSSRVEAAEKAIGRMTELLTQLASTGALPEEYASKAVDIRLDFDTIRTELEQVDKQRAKEKEARDKEGRDIDVKSDKWDAASIASKKSVFIDPAMKMDPTTKTGYGTGYGTGAETGAGAGGAAGHTTGVSSSSGGTGFHGGTSGPGSMSSTGGHGVTHVELDNALHDLRQNLVKNLTGLTARTTATADAAMGLVKSVTDQMEKVTKLNERVSNLYSLLGDYENQLTGFDDGLKMQMKGFEQLMVQMRAELNEGLKQLENVNNNAETAAVLELKEHFEVTVQDLDILLHHHGQLTNYQRELRDELRILIDCVEMMKEQKADRDEIMDGLRDKADLSRLVGLLTEADFAMARVDLEKRLETCYERFKKQDALWMSAIRDFHDIASTKADFMSLLGMREDTQNELSDIHDSVHKLALLLGDPKTALLTRQLAKDATCGICSVPALMEIETESKGAPPRLPAAWPPPQFPVEDPHIDKALECAKQWLPKPEPTKDEVHICNRYVGGSHTLIGTSAPARSIATPAGPPVRKYLDRGINGQVYYVEEPLKPCDECNPGLPGEVDHIKTPPPLDGAGDRESSRRITIVDGSKAPRTVLTDEQIARVSVPDLPQHRPTKLDVTGRNGNVVQGRTGSTLLNEEALRQAAVGTSDQRASTAATIEGEDPEPAPGPPAEHAQLLAEKQPEPKIE